MWKTSESRHVLVSEWGPDFAFVSLHKNPEEHKTLYILTNQYEAYKVDQMKTTLYFQMSTSLLAASEEDDYWHTRVLYCGGFLQAENIYINLLFVHLLVIKHINYENMWNKLFGSLLFFICTTN